MEKLLWTTLVVLWGTLLCGSAFGSVERHESPYAHQADAATVNEVTDMPAAIMSTSHVVAPAVGGLSSMRVTPMDATHGGVVVVGSQSGNEFLGGVLACALLLRYARRRRLI